MADQTVIFTKNAPAALGPYVSYLYPPFPLG